MNTLTIIPKTRNTFLLVLCCIVMLSCQQSKKQSAEKRSIEASQVIIPENGQLLFDGTTLKGWDVTSFGTEGPITISDGKIVLNYGDGCSGITWNGDFPKVNYEVKLEARKTVGNDFFCGITFPVNESFCSLIVGGWGGPVVGLSSIDGLDASENETQVLKRFDKDVWYKIRLRVDESKIQAWIDEEKLVDFDYTERKLSIRPEVNLSKPFGICTWITTAELRNMVLLHPI